MISLTVGFDFLEKGHWVLQATTITTFVLFHQIQIHVLQQSRKCHRIDRHFVFEVFPVKRIHCSLLTIRLI
jgi:hypothetical protein